MTIRSLLEKWAAASPENVAVKHCEGGVWKTIGYGDMLRGVREVAEGYGTRFSLVPREDNAAIILPNGPIWLESYLAQSGAGVAVVPIDPKLHNDEVAYILRDARVRVVTTDTAHLRMIMTIAGNLPDLRGVVIVDGLVREGQRILGRVDVVEYARLKVAGGGAWYDANVSAPADVASIIYTSGTTGRPKGAMLTNDNFVQDVVGSVARFGAPLSSGDSFFVVLPLFHAFSFTTNFVVPVYCGAKMYFNQSLRTVGRDIHDLKPTVLLAVPLLAEKLHDKIEDGLAKSKLARFLMRIGLRGPVMHMVKLKLGGRLRFIITGGAPCPRHVIECFNRIHVRFLEGYGLTECSPVVSVCPPELPKVGTIGLPVKGIEVRLADKNDQGVGELQIKGPIVMKGYFHNPEASAEAFDDDGAGGRWLRTGDLASMDEDGFITIRGRKKALIVNREGKNIYPEEVEIMIAKEPAVQDVVVVGYTHGGDPGEKVGAVIYPDEEWFKRRNGGVLPPWEEIEKTAVKRAQEKCAELADYKRVRKVVVSKEPLVRTSIGKVKRVFYKGQLDE
ncbi:MAG: AMP-binding protein [Kiritimatiellae bacterium]|nr:AMP-binding protein [Kiritimatiellia bacterium]